MSADDIARYVSETGMVFPFSFEQKMTAEKPGGVHRLKGASYEGCIGKTAYIFDRGQNHPKPVLNAKDKFLTFPANSIVFVESDLHFRLPPFLAVRFNLQIRHVHRGLLLGTGPLVDPGFWGKLCIPIHNLTDADYVVPLDEGLIWVEFTKTTIYPRLGKEPSNSDLDDIRGAISKASQPYKAQLEDKSSWKFWTENEKSKIVGIRSSIGSVLTEAKDAAKTSANAAKLASTFAGGLSVAGLAALIFAFFIMYDLWQSYSQATDTYRDNIRSLSTKTTDELADFTTELGAANVDLKGLQKVVSAQAEKILELQEQLEALTDTQ